MGSSKKLPGGPSHDLLGLITPFKPLDTPPVGKHYDLVLIFNEADRTDNSLLLAEALQGVWKEAMAYKEHPDFATDPERVIKRSFEDAIGLITAARDAKSHPKLLRSIADNYIEILGKQHRRAIHEHQIARAPTIAPGVLPPAPGKGSTAQVRTKQVQTKMDVAMATTIAPGQLPNAAPAAEPEAIVVDYDDVPVDVDLQYVAETDLPDLVTQAIRFEGANLWHVEQKVDGLVSEYEELRSQAQNSKNSGAKLRIHGEANTKLHQVFALLKEVHLEARNLTDQEVSKAKTLGPEDLQITREMCTAVINLLEDRLDYLASEIRKTHRFGKPEPMKSNGISAFSDALFREFVLGESGKVAEYVEERLRAAGDGTATREVLLGELTAASVNTGPEAELALVPIIDQLLDEIRDIDPLFDACVSQELDYSNNQVLAFIYDEITECAGDRTRLEELLKLVETRLRRLDLFEQVSIRENLETGRGDIARAIEEVKCANDPLYAAVSAEIKGDEGAISDYVSVKMREPGCSFQELKMAIGLQLADYQDNVEIRGKLNKVYRMVELFMEACEDKDESWFAEEGEFEYDPVFHDDLSHYAEVDAMRRNLFDKAGDLWMNSGSFVRDKVVNPVIQGGKKAVGGIFAGGRAVVQNLRTGNYGRKRFERFELSDAGAGTGLVEQNSWSDFIDLADDSEVGVGVEVDTEEEEELWFDTEFKEHRDNSESGVGAWFKRKFDSVVEGGKKFFGGVWEGAKNMFGGVGRRVARLAIVGLVAVGSLLSGIVSIHNPKTVDFRKSAAALMASEDFGLSGVGEGVDLAGSIIESINGRTMAQILSTENSSELKEKPEESTVESPEEAAFDGESEESGKVEGDEEDAEVDDNGQNADQKKDSGGFEVKDEGIELKFVKPAKVPVNGTMWELAKDQTQMGSLSLYQRCVTMRLVGNMISGENVMNLWVHDGGIEHGVDDSTAVKLWNQAVEDGTAEKILVNHWRARGDSWEDIAVKLHQELHPLSS